MNFCVLMSYLYSPVVLSEEEVSVYDIKDHPDFKYRPGSCVIRVVNSEVKNCVTKSSLVVRFSLDIRLMLTFKYRIQILDQVLDKWLMYILQEKLKFLGLVEKLHYVILRSCTELENMYVFLFWYTQKHLHKFP